MQSVEEAVLIVVSVITVVAIALTLWTCWSERHDGESTWDRVIGSESLKIPFARALTEYCRKVHSREDKQAKKNGGAKRKAKVEAVTDFWERAGFFFDRKTRVQMYDPLIDEIREDFLVARKLCRTNGDFTWVSFCFAKRGAFAFLRCLGVTLIRPVLRLVPAWLRHWWNLFG